MRRDPRISAWNVILILLSACTSQMESATPTANPTAAPSATPTPTQTLTPTPTSTPTPTPYPYPMRLEQVGQFGGAADMLALNGDMLYLQAGQRFMTVDISEPTNPTIVGRSEMLPIRITAIQAKDGYALVRDGRGTIWMFETPDSGDPIPVRSFEKTDPDRPQLEPLGKNTARAGRYVFELGWDPCMDIPFLQLQVYDMSNLQERVLVETAIDPLPEGKVAVATNLVIRDHYAYAAALHGLEIYDLSITPEKDEISPLEGVCTIEWMRIGGLSTDIGTMGFGCCASWHDADLFVFGDYLYVNHSIWSLAAPADPALIAARGEGTNRGFLVNGGMIPFDTVSTRGYEFLDTSNPANPLRRIVSSGPRSGIIKAVQGNRLYFYAERDRERDSRFYELQIYDVVDPYYPRLLGSYTPLPWGNQYDHFNVVSSLVFIDVTGRDPQQIVLDVSEPSNIRKVAPPTSLFFRDSVLSHDDFIFVLDQEWLYIFTTNDLLTPLAAMEIPLPPRVAPGSHIRWSTLSYADGRLYTSIGADSVTSLLIVTDVHEPAHPQILSTWGPAPSHISAYGDYLYLDMDNDGVVILKLVANE